MVLIAESEDAYATPTPLPDAAPAKPPARVNLLADGPLPTGREAEATPMKGKVQKDLLDAVQSRTPGRVAGATNGLLLHCLARLDKREGKELRLADVLALHSADRRELTLRIRRRTYPDPLVEFEWTCAPPQVPSGGCGAKTKSKVNLDLLTTEPAVMPAPVPLPISKRILTFDLPSGATEEAYMKLRRGAAEQLDLDDMFEARSCKLDGNLATRADLADLIGGDRVAILNALLAQGGPDTRLDSRCNKCGASFQTRVEGLPGFWFPVGAL